MVKAEELRLSGSELSTVETLVQELAHPEPARVIYAIDVLESLDKRNLVTPLLLYHESPKVRRRALAALGDVRSDIAQQWIPHIRRMLGDGDAGVRAARDWRVVVDQPGRCRVVRAPAPGRSRSAHPGDGGRGHDGKLAPGGCRPGRVDAARSDQRLQ